MPKCYLQKNSLMVKFKNKCLNIILSVNFMTLNV
jgi:hypothetical protein